MADLHVVPVLLCVLCSVACLSVVGQKSDDPLSTAYVQSIFSFTSAARKREAEQGIQRYEAAKRRRESRDKIEAANSLLELARLSSDGQEGSALYPPDSKGDVVSVGTQTDLTVADLTALENDYQQ